MTEREKIKQKTYRDKNRIEINRRALERYYKNNEANKKRSLNYYHKNKDSITSKRKNWREKNKIKKAEYDKKYNKNRLENDDLYKLKKNCRCRISQALVTKGIIRRKKYIELIGCSYPFLRDYLQARFELGMTWDNYGEWHIDHIIPLASAGTEQKVYKLFHYKNLQPLWALENRMKSDKILNG